ncbi:MAG: hypothetical protein IPP82_17235 [Xanthomonadales bacterium]|nr:hypothetical protein [Xanthomonadales bacterium]
MNEFVGVFVGVASATMPSIEQHNSIAAEDAPTEILTPHFLLPASTAMPLRIGKEATKYVHGFDGL